MINILLWVDGLISPHIIMNGISNHATKGEKVNQ
jgi:hypothetical protein